MSDTPPRALIAGHGSFAEGMLSAIRQIAGREELFEGVSNRDLSAADVELAIRSRLEATGAHVLFTDLPAGSCTIAARRIQRDSPGLVVVAGANLVALLDFAFRGDLPPGEAARLAAEKGRAALLVLGEPRGA
jgi:PTS system N-acetylgalactosamine-specific IIA component